MAEQSFRALPGRVFTLYTQGVLIEGNRMMTKAQRDAKFAAIRATLEDAGVSTLRVAVLVEELTTTAIEAVIEANETPALPPAK